MGMGGFFDILSCILYIYIYREGNQMADYLADKDLFLVILLGRLWLTWIPIVLILFKLMVMVFVFLELTNDLSSISLVNKLYTLLLIMLLSAYHVVSFIGLLFLAGISLGLC